MDTGAYDERVRSLINSRLRGMGKRLSSYCASVVDGGDIDNLSREFTEGVDGSVEDGIREAWAVSEAMGSRMKEEAARRGASGRDAAYAAALIIARRLFNSAAYLALSASLVLFVISVCSSFMRASF